MSVSDEVYVHGNADKTIDDTIDVTVTVNDVDDPRRINGRTTYEVNEEGSRDVTEFVAEGQDRTSAQWTFSMTGTDSDDFSLSSGGVLTFNELPSYEEPVDANEDNHYQLTIQAEEVGDPTSTATLDIPIRVNNTDEEGRLTPVSSCLQVGYAIELELTDADIYRRMHPTPSWRWERSSNRVDWELVRGAYSNINTPTLEDKDKFLRATVRYRDGHYNVKHTQYVSSLIQVIQSVPETISLPIVSTGVKSLTVSWTEPNTYPAISGYIVRHRVSGSSEP